MKKILALMLAGAMTFVLACGGSRPHYNRVTEHTKAYIVGSGVASLAAAAFLIRDGKMQGNNIYIFEEMKITGGSLDGIGSPDRHYVIRGGRMLNFETFECTWNLLKTIPSLTDQNKTVWDEIVDFNRRVKTHARARVVDRNRNILDVRSPGFTWRDRWDMVRLGMMSEDSLANRKLNDFFQPSFFQTNFWYMWSTTFAFQPWSSLIEFKRYNDRFIHEFPRINTLAGVTRTPYNQYDSIIRPLMRYLQEHGVHFEMGAEVTNIEFKPDTQEITAQRITIRRDGREQQIAVNPGDLVMMTNGSITADSDLGSMKTAPRLITGKTGGSWRLWERIAKNRPEFGHPEVFSNHINESWWESFTVTCKDPTFFNKMKEFTTNDPGTGALVTFKDSNWYMSVVLAYQPHFINQPKNIQVFWGYGLFPEKVGNFVHKRMQDCTGEEILTELLGHLKFDKEAPQIMRTSTVIPCMMPYIDALFNARKTGDRPLVVPKGSTNFAFLGQFSEIPNDTVFTVEYSVRSGMTAAYTLLGIDKEIPALYRGKHHIGVLWDAITTALR
jgi:oleate hydratase